MGECRSYVAAEPPVVVPAVRRFDFVQQVYRSTSLKEVHRFQYPDRRVPGVVRNSGRSRWPLHSRLAQWCRKPDHFANLRKPNRASSAWSQPGSERSIWVAGANER